MLAGRMPWVADQPRRKTMRRIAGVVAVLVVVVGMVVLAVVGTPIASSQGEGAPTVYTFVSQFQIPRASWAQFSEDNEKNFLPVADKLLADGTITSYTTFESIVHT